MHVPQLIERKRDGGTLTFAEVERLIAGYVAGSVPDYQMAAWAMAVFFQGLSAQETVDLTRAMWKSGGRLQRQAPQPLRVDKHSTGGVGDKVSLPLAPLLACCGLHVPMISGRGLGATGGTLDKLESIPGFRTNLAADEIEQVLASVGCVITGQTADLVPADRKLYALRDVTGTVPSIPLIAASILSKKLAEDLDVLVLDVKWGTGAFMGSLNQARELAQTMVTVAQALGLSASAMITDMNQPLGRMVGHALEVNESLDLLEGRGPEDLKELTLALGAQALVKAGLTHSSDQAIAMLQQELAAGHAREHFASMVAAQGGDLNQPREVGVERMATSPRPGYIARINTAALGHAVALLGGGRRRQGDAVDHAVGLEMLVRLGDAVREGDPLARLFVRKIGGDEALAAVVAAIEIRDEPPAMHPLIVESAGPANSVDFLHGKPGTSRSPGSGG